MRVPTAATSAVGYTSYTWIGKGWPKEALMVLVREHATFAVQGTREFCNAWWRCCQPNTHSLGRLPHLPRLSQVSDAHALVTQVPPTWPLPTRAFCGFTRSLVITHTAAARAAAARAAAARRDNAWSLASPATIERAT